MTPRIEDYGFVSNLHTGALISRHGSVDWFCPPRFDSEAVFAALLGTETHGRWLLAPAPEIGSPDPMILYRRYRKSTFILETSWRTRNGEVLVTDFMPIGGDPHSLVRRVQGVSGHVLMHHKLGLRFEYGKTLPWVQRTRDEDGEAILAIAGPEAVIVRAEPFSRIEPDHTCTGGFPVQAGQTVDLVMSWFPAHKPAPRALDVNRALESTDRYWTDWSQRANCRGKYGDAVGGSLLLLRALTHEETGGIVAAPTTSLPEQFGGERNWDYRFCWLRDAALSLDAMMVHGFRREALRWRNWLLRAVAGDPNDLRIMYGIAGERELPEKELEHLPGYEGSAPVRIGNGAASQYQGDVVGEVMVALERLRLHGGHEDHFSWPLQRNLIEFVENNLTRKDHGIWEMRGDNQDFTHSRVMMWAALDCGVRAVKEHGLEGRVERWEKLRNDLRTEIVEHGFNREINSFTQTYGGTEVDASLLVLPQVGFLDYADEKMLGTVDRIEHELLDGSGLLLRYRTESCPDGLEPGEHPFLACSFWLVEQYARTNRILEAEKLMDQLVGYSNELGLLSEEYDTVNDRMAGNFPQAFSHLALIRAADALHSVMLDCDK
jgi:GH15 family glucan-1,4-alpha-glucosidase